MMKNKFKGEGANVRLGTTIIVIVMVIVFGATFVWMHSVDLLFLPDFVENILGLDEADKEEMWDMSELSRIVRSGKNDDTRIVTFDATPENLRVALLHEEPADGLYLSAEVTHYSDGVPSVRKISYYRDGVRFRTELYVTGDSSTPELLKIANEDSITVIDRATGESSTIARGVDIESENEAMIPSVSDLMAALEASANESSSEPNNVSNCTVKLVETENGNLYYVSFTYADLGITEEYYVSLDYKIIVSLRTYMGNTPIYSYDVVGLSLDEDVYGEDSLYRVSEATEQ